jgi:hypothetical protein
MFRFENLASKGDEILPMASDDSSQLELPVGLKLFRVKHYVAVYNLALEVTGTFSAAKELTERVFDNAARRFENHPIPLNCDKYLAAQVYLLYAQKDLSTSVASVSSAQSSKSVATAPAPHDPVSKYAAACSRPTPRTNESSPPKDIARVSDPIIAESAAVLRASSVVELKSTTTDTPPAPAKTLDKQNDPVIIAAVYDKKRTEFWTPNHEPSSIQSNDSAQDEASEPDEEEDKPSVVLSILNAFLVICSLASIAFLLFELKVLPKLF